MDNMENEPDGRCIAAPIMDGKRKVIAAISVSGPLPRMTAAKAKKMLGILSQTCKDIGRDCG
jgi:DNA-binding IclR family transcriptional regulator